MAAEGSVNARWRFDEFDDTFLPLVVTAEEHTIEFIVEIAKYGFFTNESVRLVTPTSTVSVIEDDSAAFVFVEVSKLTAPDSGEFRVSFDALGFQNTGFFECNAADEGREVLVGYEGLGTINHPNFRLNRNIFLPGDVIVEGTLIIDDTTEFGDSISFEGSGNQSIDKFSIDPTLASDLDTSLVSEKAIKEFVNVALSKVQKRFTVETGESVAAGKVVEFLNEVIREGVGTHSTYGTPLVFESGNINEVSAVVLTDSKILIAYADDASTNGAAIVADISGTVPTFGSKVNFDLDTAQFISAVALTSSKVLIAWSDFGNSSFGSAIVGDISGTVITLGSTVVFESASTSDISVTALNSSKVLIGYVDVGNSSFGTSIIATISGTVPTFGTAVVFESASTSRVSAVALSESKVFIAYSDNGNSGFGTGIVGDISGTVPTFGSAEVFEDVSTTSIFAVSLESSKVFIAYRDSGSGFGVAIIADISGTSMLYGVSVTFASASTFNISVAKLSPERAIIIYTDNGNSDFGTSVIGNISGNIITFGEEVVFDNTDTVFNSIVALSESKVFIAYEDADSSQFGTSIVGEIAFLLGLSQEAGASAESIFIALRGVSNSHSGLEVNRTYYSEDGTLITTVGANKIGKAISATELLIDK